VFAPPLAHAEFVPGEVLVKFSSTATAVERDALRSTLADRVLNRFDRFGIEHWRLRSLSVESAVQQFRYHPAFTYLEPNGIVHVGNPGLG
jgi:hypothetical protein